MPTSVLDQHALPALEVRMAHRGHEIYRALLSGGEAAAELQVSPIWCDTGKRLVSVVEDFVGWTRECRAEPDADLATYICGSAVEREKLVDAYQIDRVEADLRLGYFND